MTSSEANAGQTPTSAKADLPPSAQDPETTTPGDDDETFAFKHYLLRNIRYHTRRATLFSQWHKATGFVGVFLGSFAAISFLMAESPKLASLMAVIVAFFSAVDLVIGTATKEAQHLELRRRWVALQKQLQKEGFSPALYIERTAIEMDEPAELSIVEMQARNDVTLAMLGSEGRSQLLVIPWYKRLLGQFINFDTSEIRERWEIEAAGQA